MKRILRIIPIILEGEEVKVNDLCVYPSQIYESCMKNPNDPSYNLESIWINFPTGKYENSYSIANDTFLSNAKHNKWDLSKVQLLLISNEIIKEESLESINGDCIKLGDFAFDSKRNLLHHANLCVKIIAAYPKLDNLSTFQKDFLDKWCVSPVTKVKVKYTTKDMGFEYDEKCNKSPKILEITEDNEVVCKIPKNYKEKYKNIARSDWFNELYENKSIEIENYRDNKNYKERNDPDYFSDIKEDNAFFNPDNKDEILNIKNEKIEENLILEAMKFEGVENHYYKGIKYKNDWLEGLKSNNSKNYWFEKFKPLFKQLYYKGRDDEKNEIESNTKVWPVIEFEKWFKQQKDGLP